MIEIFYTFFDLILSIIYWGVMYVFWSNVFIIAYFGIKRYFKECDILIAFLCTLSYIAFISYNFWVRIIKFIYNYELNIYTLLNKFNQYNWYEKVIIIILIVGFILLLMVSILFIFKQLSKVHFWLIEKNKFYGLIVTKLIKRPLVQLVFPVLIYLRRKRYSYAYVYYFFMIIFHIFKRITLIVLISLFIWDIIFNNGIITKLFKILPFIMIYNLLFHFIYFNIKDLLKKTKWI